jgi:hypothetical protein
MMQNKPVSTYLELDGQEVCHELWSTPVILARPFSKEFLEQLKKDIIPILNGPGKFNHNDLWNLSAEWTDRGYKIPDTMLAVKEKFLELADKHFRPHAEQPLPPLREAKGYFRHTVGNSEYKISPHKHATTYGVGVFYVNAPAGKSGNLLLMDPRGGTNWVNQFSPYKRIPVEEGMMVIHPGYLLHFVEPNTTTFDYDNRTAIVTAIHRSYDDFLQTLKENEGLLGAFGANGVTEEEQMMGR